MLQPSIPNKGKFTQSIRRQKKFNPELGFKKLKKKSILSKGKRQTSQSGAPSPRPRYNSTSEAQEYRNPSHTQGKRMPKLLHPGEKDYPSKFAKVWREFIHEKRIDNPEGEKEEKNTPDPSSCCCFSWCFCQFNHLFNTGSNKGKLTEEDLGPLPPHLRVNKVTDRALAMIEDLNSQ
jgi:hypothetical protein